MNSANPHPAESSARVLQDSSNIPTSPPPEKLLHSDSTDVLIDISEERFRPEDLVRLPDMSVHQLSLMEDKISKEYTSLVREYLDSRKPRVEFLLKAIEAQIKSFQQQDRSWAKFCNSQTSIVETLLFNTEDSILRKINKDRSPVQTPATLAEYEEEIAVLISSLESPVDRDRTLSEGNVSLPFAEYFDEIIELHKAQLIASSNHKQYHAQMLDELVEKNKSILWKQYRNDVLEFKEKLIMETRHQLETLQKEYYGVTSAQDLTDMNKYYYRSVVPVITSPDEGHEHSQYALAKGNTDKYHGIDNVYHKKNKIEITDTKFDVQDNWNTFMASQNQHKLPQLDSVTVKLDGCLGATSEQIEADINLLKSFKKPQSDNESPANMIDDLIQSDDSLSESDLSSASTHQETEYTKLMNMNRLASKVMKAEASS